MPEYSDQEWTDLLDGMHLLAEDAKQTPAAPCKMGLLPIEIPYKRGHPLVELLAGHGIRVKGRWAEAIGKLDMPTSTLVGGSGGMLVEEGDFLEHDAFTCWEGLYQSLR